jgi:hypothetical protein
LLYVNLVDESTSFLSQSGIKTRLSHPTPYTTNVIMIGVEGGAERVIIPIPKI